MEPKEVYNFLDNTSSASTSVNVDLANPHYVDLAISGAELQGFNQRIISKEDYVLDSLVRSYVDPHYNRLPQTIIWWRSNMQLNEPIGYEEYLGWAATTFYIK